MEISIRAGSIRKFPTNLRELATVRISASEFRITVAEACSVEPFVPNRTQGLQQACYFLLTAALDLATIIASSIAAVKLDETFEGSATLGTNLQVRVSSSRRYRAKER